MEDSAQFNQLLTFVRTRQDVQKVKEALDIYLSSKFSLQENVNAFALLPVSIIQLLDSLLSKEQSIDKLKIIVDQLNTKLDACPIIYLTIAFTPTQTTIEKISSKVKFMFGPESILEITVDPNIIGGIIFIQNGNYQDISFKKKLTETFNTKQTEIRSLIL